MKRREFVKCLGGAALAWPFAAQAQQSRTPVVGFLCGGSAGEWSGRLAGFVEGLATTGHVDGRNIEIKCSWAERQYDRLPALAAELVQRRPVVIAAVGGTQSALAAKAATTTIPVVFRADADPVGIGLVTSMDRPGGNATGVVIDAFGLLARRLDLLRDLLPQAAIMGVLINPTSLTPERFKTFMLAVTLNLERPTLVFSASSMGEIDEKLATAARRDVEALLVLPDPMFHREHKQIVELAANYHIPTSYPSREYAQAGGLMSYEFDQMEPSRQAGVYTGRILNGEPPSILPVLQSTKTEFVINLKTAATLGITVPPTILANADELIE